MLKLNKLSSTAALAAAVALGSSSAYATLTFNLQVTGGGNTANSAPGSTVHLTLYADITGTNPGVYDLGGSFISDGPGGFGAGRMNAALDPNFAFVGSSVGTLFDPGTGTIWGGGTAPLAQADATPFFYARAGATAGTGTIAPVLGSHLALGTIDYVVGATAVNPINLTFVPRDRPGVVDQFWQENGSSQDDTTSTPLVVGTTVSLGAVTSTWQATGSGQTWETASNWTSNTVPDFGAAVEFGTTPSTPAVTINSTHSVNAITFNGTGAGGANYAITGGGTVSLSSTSGGGGGTATISAASGTHSIQNVALAAGTGVVKSGAGTVVIGNTFGGGIDFASGGAVSITGGKLAFTNLDSSVARKTAPVLVTMNGLSLSGTGTLDIDNRDVVIHGGNYSAVNTALYNNLDFGLFDQPGITSKSVIASNMNGDPNLTTIGIMTGDEFAGAPDAPFFDGTNIVSSDVVMKYTYVGDFNLDGSVDDADLFAFLGAYTGDQLGDYSMGDTNYDGSVDDSDLFAFLANYTNQPTSGLGAFGTPVAVPEPASLVLLGLGAAGLLARKRK